MKRSTGDVKPMFFVIPHIRLAIGFVLRHEFLILERMSCHVIQLVLGTLERIKAPKDFCCRKIKVVLFEEYG